MTTYLDCIPCLVRQSVEATRFASDDELVTARDIGIPVGRLALQPSRSILHPV